MSKMQVSWTCSKFCVSAEAQLCCGSKQPQNLSGLWPQRPVSQSYSVSTASQSRLCSMSSFFCDSGWRSGLFWCVSQRKRESFVQKQHFCSHVFAKASHVTTPEFSKVAPGKNITGRIWHQHSESNLPTERVSGILNINVIYRSFYQVLL